MNETAEAARSGAATSNGRIDRTWLVIVSITSVQFGAGLAGQLMKDLGAPPVVMLRQGLAAVLLLAFARPQLLGRSRDEWRVIIAFGIVFAGMNTTFYAAVERLPLSVAVTIELLGPLGLAAALSRRRNDVIWVLVALVGVVLLGDPASGLNFFGLLLAVVAAAGWAAYILLSRSVGSRSTGVGSLGLSMGIASVLVAPFGLRAGAAVWEPRSLALGFAVAMLGALIPFSLEITALREVSARVFGVLMALSPVAALASGAVLLGERPSVRQLAAMLLVMAASVATVRGARPEVASGHPGPTPERQLTAE